MPTINYSDDEIHAKAVGLGLIEPGEALPHRLRSRVLAALAAPTSSGAAPEASRPRVPTSIVVQPGGDILIDGTSIPWAVARERIDVTSNPDGPDTVRLTLLTEHASITDPATESENRA
jgi:hypothetical protein